MRILQVVHGFPPKEWTGTELITLQLSQALRGRGHEVSVVARTYDDTVPEGTVQDEMLEQLPVFRIVNNYPPGGSFRLLYDNPWLNRPFLQLLERIRPEIVHFQHTQHLSVSLLRLAPALGYPTVLSLHDFFFACHRVHLLDVQQRLCPGPERGERCVACLQELASAEEARQRFTDMERVLRAPDVLVTPSAFLVDKMRGYFPFLTDRLRAIPLGVQAIPRITLDRTPRPFGAPLRILYVGVLAPHKGAHILLEALKGLQSEAVEVSLYGLEWSQWATYIAQLHETAKELPVKFCGTYAHDQLGEILMQHDVLVMPMIWEETFSILVREAFLARVPVIAARRGALAETIQDDVNGLLFEPENVADLQRCLARCIEEPELLERFRRAVPSVKTIEQYASEIENIYEEVITQRKRQLYFPPLEKDEKVQQMGVLLSQQEQLSESSLEKKEGEQGTKAFQTLSEKKENIVFRQTNRESSLPVSVCIPTYNGAAFLAETIKSVLSQSFGDFELLIVDDGSTDTTLDIARSFTDPRIAIYQNETQLRIPGNWNRALSLARGEYICIFHQDDVMLPENLSRKVTMLTADPMIAFVHSAVEFVVEAAAPNPPIDWIDTAVDDGVIDGMTYFYKLLFRNCICAPAVIMRRTHMMNIGQFDERLGFACDYVMWMKLCAEGHVGFISQPLLLYRWHQQNASHAFRFKREVDETLLARQDALQHYVARTGMQQETRGIMYALYALAEWHRRVVALDAQSERQIAYIREVEQMKDKIWADAQRVGKAWEEQYRYIQELEQMKDRIWEDSQRVGKSWEEQKTHIENQQRHIENQQRYIENQQRYITELEQERARLAGETERLATEGDELRAELQRRLPERLGRFARRMSARVRSRPTLSEAKD